MLGDCPVAIAATLTGSNGPRSVRGRIRRGSGRHLLPRRHADRRRLRDPRVARLGRAPGHVAPPGRSALVPRRRVPPTRQRPSPEPHRRGRPRIRGRGAGRQPDRRRRLARPAPLRSCLGRYTGASRRVPGMPSARPAVHGHGQSATCSTSSPAARGAPAQIWCSRPADERELMRSGLHLGVVVDEHRLGSDRRLPVRNLLGVDKDNGALPSATASGRADRASQVRAGAADEDLRLLLEPVDGDAVLLFTCNGPRSFGVRRRRARRRPVGPGAAGRRVLRGRDRPRRRSQLPARLHGERRGVRIRRGPEVIRRVGWPLGRREGHA